MNLGERLKEARELKGYTQVHVAKILGITNTSLSNYERGERDPDTFSLNRLAQFYGVSVDWLLGRIGSPSPYDDPNKVAVKAVEEAISDDAELTEFWHELKEREDLQLLFKQVKPLSPDTIKRIIRYIKMVEDEEAKMD